MGQTNFLQALGWAVLNSLWQMALLWFVYQLVTGLYRSSRSSLKTSLAVILICSGFAWFVYTFFSIWISTPAAVSFTQSGVAVADNNPQVERWLRLTLPIASSIYLVLLVLPVLHFGRNYRYVQAIRRFGLMKADVQWRIFVDKVSAQIGIRKKVRIWISEFVSSPVTVGFLKPVILFPMAAVNHLSPQQFEAILLHELSHIRRNDYLLNLVINAIQTLLYFNPFVKAFVKTIEREREKSCDEMVMQFQYDPHGYASALLILEKNNPAPKVLAVAASGKRNDLLNRIENILGIRKNKMISFNRMAGLFAGLLCFIALNAVLILNRPADSYQQGSFTSLSSPFNFFTSNYKAKKRSVNVQPAAVATAAASRPTESSKPIESPDYTVTNHADRKAENKSDAHISTSSLNELRSLTPTMLSNGLLSANFEQAMAAPLKSYQEAQVKEAIDVSKKVIANIQWKELEKTIADALTQTEKNKVKSTYIKQLEKIDWEKMGDRLRAAYNNIDWEKIDEQLSKAMNIVRLDSLQDVYTEKASHLDHVADELEANDMTGIPDSDITLKQVEQKKVEVQRLLHSIKLARTKKVIHL